jgi:triphosphoribosyl-dephospho-CoA synthase
MARRACEWEVLAPKAGNVHPGASFEDCTVKDFLKSAAALEQAFLCHATVGEMVLETVRLTRSVVATNTNLGIALLLAPLVVAEREGDVNRNVPKVLDELSTTDARMVYSAICLAAPGGLGKAPTQDVAEPPSLPLKHAMALAADRDLIAHQYTTNFTDVFDFGVPTLARLIATEKGLEAAIVSLQLQWLAHTPDTLIARKLGQSRAQDVQARASHVLARGGIWTPEWTEFDAYLRSDGNRLNPGAIADLIAATLFICLANHTLKYKIEFEPKG